MTEAASLIEKYKGAEGADQASFAQLHQKILDYTPEWEKYSATRSHCQLLKSLSLGDSALKAKAFLESQPDVLACCMDGLMIEEDKPVQWLLTFFYDLLREDDSCFSLFEAALKSQVAIRDPLLKLLGRQQLDAYIADKAAWLLTAVIGNIPQFFCKEDVTKVVAALLGPGDHSYTDVGNLEAVTNLLKSDSFRRHVWCSEGVAECIFRVAPREGSSPLVYRFVFAIWMLSFDKKITADLVNLNIVKKLKDILTVNRTEKAVRLCLTLLKNFLAYRPLCEEIVEEGILEAVQQLEFEKWRDAELYDDIRDMSAQISSEVQEMSNFDRYERELQTGTLTWGFIHSSKFWAENVLKFEQHDFKALRMLTGLLYSPDPATLAVACHDLGEFVAMHPLGKKKVAQLQIKERVMELMGSTDPAYREVRREALLCCQKIMLNKWQEVSQ